MRKILSFVLTILTMSGAAYGAAPANYYSAAKGKSGKALAEAIGGIISNHTALSYNNLWTAYGTTDLDENGKVWDMYSTKRWTFKKEQCGNYSSIGGCYNREHSMPKSWFNDASPMYTDLFHLYPTDGYVNNQRSNYPFGECANGTYVASSGSVKPLGKRGASTYPGYSGTVFEPDDQYKGDFARSYFYMATCYIDRNASWSSDMLAGNNYPFFTSWATEMLLKWHRLDPVSDKELDRNEAVYALQHNRNPFIDNPELAEYIWGDKKGEAWTPGKTEAAISQPADGTTVDFGITATNHPVSKKINLLTVDAADNTAIAVSGPFTTSTGSCSASATNAGTEITVTYNATATGHHSGTLTVTCGKAKSTVTLTGETTEGLPVGKATYITAESFRANWTYVGDDINGKYELTVADSEGNLDGYPMMVDAAKGYCDIKDLQPLTSYTYTLRGNTIKGNNVSVQTADLEPFIDFLFDGTLYFTTTPGEPSEVAEILVDIENIYTDITISIAAPFELSVDRSTWSHSVTINPDENRIYLRLNSATAGKFDAILKASAGNYTNDNTSVSGTAASATFLEDFEASPAPESTFNGSVYNGSAATWNLYNAGYWQNQDYGYDSDVSVRFAKASTKTTAIEMAEDKQGGAGTISFRAKRWNSSEAAATIAVETSTDGGTSWREVGSVTIEDPEWKQYTFTANVTGNVRMRLRRTAGARVNIDDIAIGSYSTGVSDPTADRHQWDAVSAGGVLTVTVDKAGGIDAGIYSVSGITIFEGHLPEGVHTFGTFAPGQFVIVSSGDFSRTVMIR